MLVINQDAGNAQLGGTRLVLPTLTAHLNVPRPFNDEDLVLTSSASTNGGRTFGRVELAAARRRSDDGSADRPGVRQPTRKAMKSEREAARYGAW